MAGYRGRIERVTGTLLDRAAETGRFELMAGLAAPLPIAVITNCSASRLIRGPLRLPFRAGTASRPR
jgi:cytochrome P450